MTKPKPLDWPATQVQDRARATSRLRILFGEAIALGPGKAELLERIQETGSISAAARRMGMSYRRAWVLVETMNQSFRRPLVETAKGGAGGGGARVSDLGIHSTCDIAPTLEVPCDTWSRAVSPWLRGDARPDWAVRLPPAPGC